MTDQTLQNQTGYVPGLDGLRAFAIVAIVLYHMFPGAVRGGYLGVTVFFVLSGYLLSRTSLKNRARGALHPLGFYRRRLRRIYPALLWVTALTLVALRLFLPGALAGVRQEVLSVVCGWQNWRQILQSQDYFARITATSPFTHMWSLAVELQFYLVWPLLFLMYHLEMREGNASATTALLLGLALVSALAMAMVYYLTGSAARVYYGTDTRAHALLLGCALGMLPAREKPVSKPLGAAAFCLCAGGLAALSLWLNGAWAGAYYGLIALSAVLSAGLVLLCARPELPFGRALDWAPLKWLGQRSYELYLVMYPVLFFLERLRPVQGAALHLLEAALILALACAVHALSSPRAWEAPEGMPGWRFVTRPAFWAAVIAVSAGVVVLAGAPEGHSDMDALAQSLEANRAEIEQRQTSPAPEPTAAPELADHVPEAQTLQSASAFDPASVTLVGDSVLLGALPALQEALPGCVVDGKVSRQVWDAAETFDALEASGQLGDIVVIALGTNGTFSPEQGQALVDRLGPDRQIYWVTVYGSYLAWQEQSNEAIRAVAAQNDNVTLIDWAALAAEHGDWLYSDGIHLQSPGQQGYAAMIADAIQ